MSQTPSPVWGDTEPPSTPKEPTVRTLHGDAFEDPYEWLRAKEEPRVRAQLEAENAYAEAVTAPLAGLRTRLFREIRERVQETDLTVPVRDGAWWWFARTTEGHDHPVYCRVPAVGDEQDPEAWEPPVIRPGERLDGEQTVLDAQELSESVPFFALGSFSRDRAGNLLTYSVDDSGDERYTQYVKDLRTGQLLADRLEEVFAGGFLTPDGRWLIYTLVDDSWRPCEIRAHRIGTPVEADLSLLVEQDPTMWLGCGLSSDETHLIFESGHSETTEIRLLELSELDADGPAVPWLLLDRGARVLASADPVELEGVPAVLLVLDDAAPDGQLVVLERDAARAASGRIEQLRRAWTALLAPQPGRRVEAVTLGASHAVVGLRQDTISQVGFLPQSGIAAALRGGTAPEPFFPAFDEQLFTASLSHCSVHSPVVRLVVTSWTTPSRVYDYLPQGRRLLLRREQPVLGGFDARDYTAYRDWAEAPDGTRIPVSVMHRADLDLDAEHPVLQYGYGSYEASMDPYFSIPRLSLLDRGVIYVVAHVRGGGELGRAWYTEGKKLAKRNTFTDFIAVTDHLAAQPWVDAARIVAEGGSAGGLLMGAVANLAPRKYAGILAVVPFVDPVTSISDPQLPLSALEWEEWGNPIEDERVYRYMRGYAPYENVAALPYPPIAAITSLNDTRVLYVEPAKWVPALREASTSGAPVLLRTEMDGGHGGGSGRYQRWEDTAWEYAFLLNCLGLAEAAPARDDAAGGSPDPAGSGA